MKIANSTGVHGSNYSPKQNINGANQDRRLQSIQKQIENVQQQLQSLSSNEEMSTETKANRRKELQQQLQELNKQMTQRKREIIQEKREESTAKVEKQEAAQGDIDKREANVIGTTAMRGILSADASLKQAKTVQSVKTSMEGKAGVLESEIKMDAGRGGSTKNKEAELAELNDRIHMASADLMDKISDIDTTLDKSRVEKDEDKTDAAEAANQGERGSEATQTQASGDRTKGQHVDVTV